MSVYDKVLSFGVDVAVYDKVLYFGVESPDSGISSRADWRSIAYIVRLPFEL